MRSAFATMGTVASLTLDAPLAPTVRDALRELFDDRDRVFSLYREDSALAKLARGEADLADMPDAVREEYELAVAWRARTQGWFTPHRPDGIIDLSGTVKATSIARGVDLLDAAGASGLIGVGGDIALVGSVPRRVGIVDPHDRTTLLADIELGQRRAIATSGRAERGDHIWSRLGPSDIDQVSVLADDILTADVLATAIVAAGSSACAELLDAFEIDALIVSGDDLSATPGWPAPRI